MNMDSLENQVKVGSTDKRGSSSHTIKETLTRLQTHLQNFTQLSKKNQGDLRKITQSTISSNRNSIAQHNAKVDQQLNLSPIATSDKRQMAKDSGKPPQNNKISGGKIPKQSGSHL